MNDSSQPRVNALVSVLCIAMASSCSSVDGFVDPIASADGSDGSATDSTGADSVDGGPDNVEASSGSRCVGLSLICGLNGDSDCCASTTVPGGTFYRSYDGVTYSDQTNPATLSDFGLDLYEVTVGRFRQFLDAGYGTQAKPPQAGSGKNPNNPTDSGWESSWNEELPIDRSALSEAIRCGDPKWQTWTVAPSTNENMPINCVTWFEAAAFCIWDDGRLPTEAEWNYAASGGAEQRAYPWSNPPTDTTIGDSYAVYCSGSCEVAPPILPAGSKPKGNGRWGHVDLGGNLYEWVLDWYAPYLNPCTDCANLVPSSSNVVRGGDFDSEPERLLASRRGYGITRPTRGISLGFRCAR